MSYLQDYRIFSTGDESPPTYHLFSSLVGLASIVSRRVWLDLGRFRVFPNLYVVLVGPPGVRKTTAMGLTRKLLNSVEDVSFAAEALTKEALQLELVNQTRSIEDLPEEHSEHKIYSPLTVFATELSNFLGRDPMQMIDFLTTIYDHPGGTVDSKTKNKGSVSIMNPCLNLIAGTTPDWITFYLKEAVISGGFSRRCIFVYELEEGPPVPIPEVTAAQRLAFDRAADYGRKLKTVSGPFTWDQDAKEWYCAWYIRMRKEGTLLDDTVVGYQRSKHIQAFKIAMLLSLSESVERRIRLRDFQGAVEMLGMVETNMARVFEGIGRNQLNAVGSKVVDLMHKAPTHKFAHSPGVVGMLNNYGLQGTYRVEGETIIVPQVLQEKQLRAALWKHANGPEMDQIINQLVSSGKLVRLNAGDKVFLCLKT